MDIQSAKHHYHVHNLVAQTAAYRLYLSSQEGSEEGNLLQIAVDASQNGELDRAAYFLGSLLERAEQLEVEFERVKKNPKSLLNYQLCFPELVESFTTPEQGDRRINVFRFRGVQDPRVMVPVRNIRHRDHRRVDIRTSVWMMGKLLKVLGFAHDMGVTVKMVTPGNILISPEQHYVVIFNWAAATRCSDGVSSSDACEEIKSAARVVVDALGGSPETGDIPDDGTPEFAPYRDRLVELARDGDRSAASAHQAFYALVDSLWPRGFHSFTTFPM